MICTRTITADQPVSTFGEACPECQHTMAGHPGTINPGLDACLVCEVQAVVAQLRDQVQAVGSSTLEALTVVDRRLASVESWRAGA